VNTIEIIELFTDDPLMIGLILTLVITSEVLRAVAGLRAALLGTGCLTPILLILGLLLLAHV